jgi:cell division protein FtsA
MEEETIVGIDIGTSKICALVGRIEAEDQIRVLGVGIEPSQGIRKGAVVDIAAASRAITHAVDKAERTSGLEINSALVTLAGSQIQSMNNMGVAGISGRTIDQGDIMRAMDAARAVQIPQDQEVIHVIQRSYRVDGQDGIRSPIGMHGYRLEVEAHIITASASSVENLRQCVNSAGVEVSQFVLNSLAAGEIALSDAEREMGVVLCDVGGGTTDMAIYIEGDVWHTAVLSLGGDHISSDIAHGLRLATDQAELIKRQHGHAGRNEISLEEIFTVRPFGDDVPARVSRADLAHIIGARTEEIFGMVLQEIKRSGYDGLLPAGVVLTGGTSLLPGIRSLAGRVLGMPVRVAYPENLVGMVDQLDSPAYAASVGLLKWAMLMNEIALKPVRRRAIQVPGLNWEKVKGFLGRLLP